MSTLETFGLFWDDSVVYQSQQLSKYHSALLELKNQQLIYPCVCTRKALAEYFSKNPGLNIYPGFCRNQEISENQAHALRVKTTHRNISFTDQLQGNITENLQLQHGDFILQRKDQIIAYQLAVVIDDDIQQVNEIVRGIDLLDSTVKQIYLQEKLGLNSPHYMHVPVLIDNQGCKLSKQTLATAVKRKNARLILYKLLNLLNQSPPIELNNAPVEQQLSWAVNNWQPENLKKIRAISQ